MIKPRVVFATLGALTLSVVFAAACSHDDDHNVETGPCSDPNVISVPTCPTQDSFSDEACQSFDDRTTNGQSTASDARAPSISAPTEGQAVISATPFTPVECPDVSAPPHARDTRHDLR